MKIRRLLCLPTSAASAERPPAPAAAVPAPARGVVGLGLSVDACDTERGDRCDRPARGSLLAWTPTLVVMLLTAWCVLRRCNYDLLLPLKYLAYFGLQVVLPGILVMHLLALRPATLSTLVALAIPTGFAVDIFSFLGLSALGAHAALSLRPAVWLAIGAIYYRRKSVAGLRLSLPSPGVGLAMAVLMLLSVVIAASQMYSEAPLVDGLPQRPIFHDWVYLLSRAATIKHMWPLQDPSLAGTALQYHYFLLVHVAAASLGTGVDVSWILLRLVVVPLGAVLLVQAYALGRQVCGSRVGGVLAAMLTLLPGELSFLRDYNHLTFLGLFVRWLYVSPTFFFGLIFFGGLLLAVPMISVRPKPLLWLALLAAAGTAAKGSVLPVILGAMFLWLAWGLVRDRRVSAHRLVIGAVLGAAFLLVYARTMMAWGTGEAVVQPFRICHLSAFWQQHAIPVIRALKRDLHAPDLGTWLGSALVGAGVAAGTGGVRMLGLLPVFAPGLGLSRRWVRWLFASVIACGAFGLALHLDGDGELYFLLPMRLPLAILSAGTCVATFRAWRARLARPPHARGSTAVHYAAIGATTLVIGTCLTIQVAATTRCQLEGWRNWMHWHPNTKINADLLPLYETTRWLREHTEPNAVLMSNAFTLRNVAHGRGVLIDHTTAGVYYYFSALTERRMWIEGPTYLLHPSEVRHRLVISSRMFYGHSPVLPRALAATPTYLIVDHSIPDAARVPPTGGRRVFANERFEVYLRNPSTPDELAQSQ